MTSHTRYYCHGERDDFYLPHTNLIENSTPETRLCGTIEKYHDAAKVMIFKGFYDIIQFVDDCRDRKKKLYYISVNNENV